MSCQPCGCDPEARHVCEYHQISLTKLVQPLAQRVVSSTELLQRAKPVTPQTRKEYPLATGLLDYFPDALWEVAHTSWAGNQQHHPDKPLHWDRSKSTDEADALLRHFTKRGTFDEDGVRHSAKVAWRALALLQKELEGEKR